MGFKLGRVLGAAVGWAVAGPIGAVIGAGALSGRKKAPEQAPQQQQHAAYENQMKTVREEQSRLNERLATAQSQTNAGIARASRSRARGGIFGESSNAGSNLSQHLG